MQEAPGPRPYDVSSRQLIDRDPAAWLTWAGLPPDGPISSLDSEVSIVLAEVDKVLRVEAATPWLAHLEVQSSRDDELPLRLLEYHALLRRRHKLRVSSVVILLRREADSPGLSGVLELDDPLDEVTLAFRYRVIRVWERPVEEILNGGIGILPLAPLANVTRSELPTVVDRMAERLAREAPSEQIGDIWSATLLLMGLRYHPSEAREVMQRMNWLRDSTTYHMILEEGREEGRELGLDLGRIEGERRLLVRLGTAKFGAPDARVAAALGRIHELDRLERLGVRLLDASSWEDLLTTDAAN